MTLSSLYPLPKVPSAIGRHWLAIAVIAWVIALGAGFAIWHNVDMKPTGKENPDFESERSGPAVALYVHTHCPCTRKALPAFLASIADAPAGIDVRIVFVRPPGVEEGWERSKSWEMVQNVSGLVAEVDVDGRGAKAEGVSASGTIVIRDESGRVRYRGGLDREGARAIAARCAGRELPPRTTGVSGCPLLSRE